MKVDIQICIPLLTYHSTLTKCNEQFLLQAAMTVYHHEILQNQHKLPTLVATLLPPCWHCSLSIHTSFSLPQ